MTPAEKEAYANADSNRVMLYTLELNHPGFTQPLRIVCDNDALIGELETGIYAEFIPFYFKLSRPPISEEPDPVLSITVDNVSGFMTPYLEAASRSGQSISVIFRPYLAEEEPGQETIITRMSSIELAIRNATANMSTVTLTAGYVNPANLQFPSEIYTTDRFTAL